MARTDYYYNENASDPDSIRPAAAVAIFDKQDRLLLLKRKDNDKWTMPGGTMDFGESLTDCAIREVKEETNLDVDLVDIIGIYTDPNILIGYSNGELRQEFTVVYSGKIVGASDVRIDDESKEFKWFALNDLERAGFAQSQRFRIQDLLEYRKSSSQKLRSSLTPNKKLRAAYFKVKECAKRNGARWQAPRVENANIKPCFEDVCKDMGLSDDEKEALRKKINCTGGPVLPFKAEKKIKGPSR